MSDVISTYLIMISNLRSSDNFVVICKTSTGQEHVYRRGYGVKPHSINQLIKQPIVFRIYFLTNELVNKST